MFQGVASEVFRPFGKIALIAFILGFAAGAATLGTMWFFCS